jgi:hypothetical protein
MVMNFEKKQCIEKVEGRGEGGKQSLIHDSLEELEELYNKENLDIIGIDRARIVSRDKEGKRISREMTLADFRERENKFKREDRRIKLQALKLVDDYWTEDNEGNKEIFNHTGLNKEKLLEIIKNRETVVYPLREGTFEWNWKIIDGESEPVEHSYVEMVIRTTQIDEEIETYDKRNLYTFIVKFITHEEPWDEGSPIPLKSVERYKMENRFKPYQE